MMAEIKLSFWKQKEIPSAVNEWKDNGLTNGDVKKFIENILEQKQSSKVIGSATIRSGKKIDKKRIRKIITYIIE